MKFPFCLFKRQRGVQFEALARHFLECQGYSLITQNFTGWQGEIDLIMTHGNQLAFIEVRYRESLRFGSPLDSIDYAKQQRIIATAEVFFKRYPSYRSYHYRFDAVLIGPDYLHWLKNAF